MMAQATEQGKLGSLAKCATAMPNPNATDPNSKVICVYTYDAEDKDDVIRIAWELYQLGVAPIVLNYKQDRETSEGKYVKRGYKRVSRYSVHISHFKDKTRDEFIKFFKEKYT